MAEDLKSNTNMPGGDIRGVITGRENTIAAKEVDIQPHKTESSKCVWETLCLQRAQHEMKSDQGWIG